MVQMCDLRFKTLQNITRIALGNLSDKNINGYCNVRSMCCSITVNLCLVVVRAFPTSSMDVTPLHVQSHRVNGCYAFARAVFIGSMGVIHLHVQFP